ncbi:MAG: hypothetical protein J0I20_16795 [Chloroflexi bacterium]|nr:hypothetical protein [Chloroflexota bacterium]OJV88798.1 MAG: hypothetical protein BGO39_04675 [Chloroflexi bacterium 54-19]
MSFNPETGRDEAPRLNPTIRKSKKKLYGALGGAALALAVAFGGTSLLGQTRTTNAQTTTPSQSATPSTGSGSNQTPTANNGQTTTQGKGGMHGGFAGGPGRMGMMGGGPGGTISAISGNTITIKHGDSITTTVTVNDSTVYTEAGKKISLSDLAVGERVNVRTTKASDGTVTVTAIDVVLDRAGGTISAVDSSGLTLTGPNNTTVKVTFGSSVTVQDAGKTLSTSDLKTGDRVEVAGQKNSDGSITTQVVNVIHDHLGGTVTAISGNTITVEVAGRGGFGGRPGGPGPRGNNGNGSSTATPSATPSTGSSSNSSTPVTTTRTITVSDSTTYTKGGQSSQLSAIAVGDRVNAEGTLSSDGNSLTALQVNIQLPHYAGKVTSVNGSTIVIDERGTSRTIEVTADTKYQNGPNQTASLSDVKTGEFINAEGSVDSSGKMTASVVNVGGPAGPGAGGPGMPGGPGGKMGPGGMGGMGGHHGGR